MNAAMYGDETAISQERVRTQEIKHIQRSIADLLYVLSWVL